jgi:hypothetical protein
MDLCLFSFLKIGGSTLSYLSLIWLLFLVRRNGKYIEPLAHYLKMGGLEK